MKELFQHIGYVFKQVFYKFLLIQVIVGPVLFIIWSLLAFLAVAFKFTGVVSEKIFHSFEDMLIKFGIFNRD